MGYAKPMNKYTDWVLNAIYKCGYTAVMFNGQMTPKEFNMYLITDTYGTRQRAWTRSEALAWLAACSPEAQVHNIWGRLVATRTVGA
jgi:hypothetical protein